MYWTFVGASFLLAVAPGPDNMFVLVQSAVHGAKAGLCVVLGLLAGIVCQTLAAALGVAAIVAASPWLFWSIRILGALYLLYLAYMSWMHPVAGEGKSTELKEPVKLFRRGWIMNITNPKVQIFFLAFFPQFVTPGAGSAQTAFEMVILGVTFMGATAVVFGAVALFAGILADKLRTPTVQSWLNRIAAVVFVLLAVGTLLSV